MTQLILSHPIVNSDNVLLVPTPTIVELVAAMVWFIEYPEQWQRMANNSRKMVEDKFNVHQVNAAISDIIAL